MIQELESAVHDAFSLLVSGMPADAGERLRGIDYHPRTRRLSPGLTAGAIIGAAATTTTIVSVVVLGGSQTAFAGWSPSPSPAPIVLTSSTDSACRAQLADTPAGPGIESTGPWSEVATDVRGPFTLVIYEDGDVHATCLTGPSITVVSRSGPTGGSMAVSQSGGARAGGYAFSSGSTARSWSLISGTGDDSSSGQIKDVVIAHLASTSQGAYTFVEGQVDPGVTGVTVVRSDGEDVQATTDNGWFLAWWPGSDGATSAQITTSEGVTTQVLDTPPPPPPPPAGGSGAASTGTP